MKWFKKPVKPIIAMRPIAMRLEAARWQKVAYQESFSLYMSPLRWPAWWRADRMRETFAREYTRPRWRRC